MKRILLKSKIHRATVTEADLEYEGSVTIDADLLHAANIVEYERVEIYNITSGRSLSIKHVLERLLEHTDVRPQIALDPERMRPTDVQIGDGSRLRAATGWVPRTELSHTLLAVLVHWRSQIAGPEFSPPG